MLPDIENDFNVTINKSTGYSPHTLMFGETRRLRAADQLLADLPTRPDVIDADVVNKQANERLKKITEQTVKNFNEKRVKAVPYSVGDKVAIQDSQLAGGGKLKPKYHGPFDIISCLPNERYAVQRVGGRRKITVVAHEQLRSWPECQQ